MSSLYNEKKFPGTATVYIEAGWGDYVGTGSGALVGKNDVLTASHVIYSKKRGGRPDWIRVYPSYNPAERRRRVLDSYTPIYYNYFTEFDPDGNGKLIFGDRRISSKQGAELDLALLSFNQNLGKKYGHFGWLKDFSFGPIHKLGYPSKYGNKLIYDKANLEYDSIDNSIDVFGKLELNPGDSGGPFFGFFFGESTPRVVGVVSTGRAATGIKGHYKWLRRMTSKNDDLIGKARANIHHATNRADRLTGEPLSYDQFVFSRGTASAWSSGTADSILGYESGDHLSFKGFIHDADIVRTKS